MINPTMLILTFFHRQIISQDTKNEPQITEAEPQAEEDQAFRR